MLDSYHGLIPCECPEMYRKWRPEKSFDVDLSKYDPTYLKYICKWISFMISNGAPLVEKFIAFGIPWHSMMNNVKSIVNDFFGETLLFDESVETVPLELMVL